MDVPRRLGHLVNVGVNLRSWDWAIAYYRELEQEGREPAWLAGFVDRMDERLGLV